ncbi:hypothetical protein [Pelagovum pacificum]|uniref:Uncharacterized protein n=2 Tax=Pelagovum pacificum TaxID=2588711 RepID=A0A5C5GHK1_9RHOB|nr:hypothetical protein [Pelagovum pacificum]TNY32926.1 hypothetical protein FHY64_06515 [Pelagovum pacificum]
MRLSSVMLGRDGVGGCITLFRDDSFTNVALNFSGYVRAMSDLDSSRTVFRALRGVAWLVIFTGVLVAVLLWIARDAGTTSGSASGATSLVVGLAVGGAISTGGLVLLAIAHLGLVQVAVFDAGQETTGDGSVASARPVLVQSNALISPIGDDHADRSTVYRGTVVRDGGDHLTANGQRFASVEDAKADIDRRLEQSST